MALPPVWGFWLCFCESLVWSRLCDVRSVCVRCIHAIYFSLGSRSRVVVLIALRVDRYGFVFSDAQPVAYRSSYKSYRFTFILQLRYINCESSLHSRLAHLFRSFSFFTIDSIFRFDFSRVSCPTLEV